MQRIMDHINANCKHQLKTPSCEEWRQIAEEFEIKCNFPHCFGAVDGKQ